MDEFYEDEKGRPDDLLRLYLQEMRVVAGKARAEAQGKRNRVKAHLPFVVTLASRYSKRVPNIGLLDLIQEGNLGLLRASETFEECGKETPFGNYAYWHILHEILLAIRLQSRTVRLPESITDHLPKLHRVSNALPAELGREPALADIAEKMELPPSQVQELLIADRSPLSLDIPLGEGENPLGDELEDEKTPSPFDVAARHNLADQLAILSRREEEVVRLRFGIGEHAEHTEEEAARRLGVSRGTISTLTWRALKKLRCRALLSFN